MPTPAERRALLFVAAVAALGLAVRGGRAWRHEAVPATDREALARQLAAVDSALVSRPSSPPRPPRPPSPAPHSSPPPSSPQQLDLDLASAPQLESLPGIGPALAARIVASRDSLGPFGSLEGLQRVKGIGPALAARLAPHVTFSGRTHP